MLSGNIPGFNPRIHLEKEKRALVRKYLRCRGGKGTRNGGRKRGVDNLCNMYF
jgi:hypothetical protein